MSSAFEETDPNAVAAAAADNKKLTIGSSGDDSDTEDEEVAMNCLGGFRGVGYYDMNTTDASSSDEEDEDLDDENEQGVVTFVSNHIPIRSVVQLVCPKPTSPNQQGSSPFDEEDPSNPASSSKDDDDEESDSGGDKEDEEDGYHLGGLDAKGSAADESPDTELKGMLDSVGDILDSNLDESETSNFQYIGVAEDGHRSTVDIVPALPKSKRVLSYNTLFALNREASHSNDTTKRMKRYDLKDWPASAPTTLFSSFSLGPPAMQHLPPLRDESPIISD